MHSDPSAVGPKTLMREIIQCTRLAHHAGFEPSVEYAVGRIREALDSGRAARRIRGGGLA